MNVVGHPRSNRGAIWFWGVVLAVAFLGVVALLIKLSVAFEGGDNWVAAVVLLALVAVPAFFLGRSLPQARR